MPGGETHGGHAYRENEEVIIALSGSFDVLLDDGKGGKDQFSLDSERFEKKKS